MPKVQEEYMMLVPFEPNGKGLCSEARSHVVKSVARSRRLARQQQLSPIFTEPLPWCHRSRVDVPSLEADLVSANGGLDGNGRASHPIVDVPCGELHLNLDQLSDVGMLQRYNTHQSYNYDEISDAHLVSSGQQKPGAVSVAGVPNPCSTRMNAKSPDQRPTLRLLGVATTTSVAALDRRMLTYFIEKADVILNLNTEIMKRFAPVKRLFLPFALESRWCFETMVVLLSAYHCRRSRYMGLSRIEEDEYIGVKRNMILEMTQLKILALEDHGDSSDKDVVALLFLAAAEYLFGDRKAGLLHLEGWKTYLQCRREHEASPIAVEAKAIVWWVVTMLIETDMESDTILDPAIAQQIKDHPARLFAYVDRHRWSQGSQEPDR
jgi:hypothetical protein